MKQLLYIGRMSRLSLRSQAPKIQDNKHNSLEESERAGTLSSA